MNRMNTSGLSWRDGIVCVFWLAYGATVVVQVLRKPPGPGDLDFLANRFLVLMLLFGLGGFGLIAGFVWWTKMTGVSRLITVLGLAATGLSLSLMLLTLGG